MENDVVLCEVPLGGVLFINNMIPHRRYFMYTLFTPTFAQVDVLQFLS